MARGIMTDILTFLKQNLAEHFVIYFIPLYLLGGRPAAVLSAQLLGYKISFIVPVVILLDTLQIPLFYHLLSTLKNSRLLQRFRLKSDRQAQAFRHSRLLRWLQFTGVPGVVLITMLPLKGCGMLSGVLLTRLLQLSKPLGYLLLVLGSLLGCLLLAGVGGAILELWQRLVV
jgi:uncharacterized membrane protein